MLRQIFGTWGLGLLAALIGVAGATAAWPTLDLGLTDLVRRLAGGGFMPDGGWLSPLYRHMQAGQYAVIAGAALLGLLAWWRGGRWLGLDARRAAFVVLSFALGPGLIVEAGFKDHWGRARPREVVAYGGQATFTPWWQRADQCVRNCSMPSGHAATAFTTLSLALLLPAGWRRRGAVAALAFGLVTGGMRMVQGGHFASDVALAGLICVAVVLALARLMRVR
ncbi:phosphatase PAP2 family protein [Zavarzinia sp. CC-PAN008]|uniref:phosphatase PAP2 family protein n=1 Tax=Zavarzinia sp. CC-PAN008 TaxID=3243332 RepID=UPI003F7436D1